MAVSFTRVSLWLWGAGGSKESSTSGSPMSSSSDFGFRDLDVMKKSKGNGAKMTKSAKPRRKWQSREERWRKVDREFDVVVVPSDGGGCMSGSDSEDSDWSIGWLEPHAADFFSEGGDCESEVETSFAVLVPCYGRLDRPREGMSFGNHIRRVVDLSSGILPEETQFAEQLLSTFQNG